MKIKEIILSLIIGSTLLGGCGTKVADTKLKTESISKAKTESIAKAKAKAKLVSDAKSKAKLISDTKSKASTVTKPATVDTTTSASKKK